MSDKKHGEHSSLPDPAGMSQEKLDKLIASHIDFFVLERIPIPQYFYRMPDKNIFALFLRISVFWGKKVKPLEINLLTKDDGREEFRLRYELLQDLETWFRKRFKAKAYKNYILRDLGTRLAFGLPRRLEKIKPSTSGGNNMEILSFGAPSRT